MRLDSVTVGGEAVEAVLRFDPAEGFRTSAVPGIADAALRALPGLKGHRCDNGQGLTFADELRDTELAHLVEHAALEIMALAGSPATLKGATRWDFTRDGRGVFRVRVEFDDSATALAALSLAAELVDALVHGVEPADIEAEARRLRLRRAPHA